jgi:hypothetical protein
MGKIEKNVSFVGTHVALNVAVAGANPTIVSYSASAVKNYNVRAAKFYNATSSLVRFENEKNLLRKNALAYNNAGVVVVSRRIGSNIA